MAGSKHRAWRPEKGQWFNAYVRQYNKLHVCAPFWCTGAEPDDQTVYATDATGARFELELSLFRLEKIF